MFCLWLSNSLPNERVILLEANDDHLVIAQSLVFNYFLAMPESPLPSNFEKPSSFWIPKSLASEQPTQVWRERLDRLAKPRVVISAFLAVSAFYCFAIGRDRYTAVSEFVIQQAAPLNTSSASVLAGAASAPQVLTSLVDGQYLQVYLESADVKTRLFPDAKKLEQDYQIKFPIRAGLRKSANAASPSNFLSPC